MNFQTLTPNFNTFYFWRNYNISEIDLIVEKDRTPLFRIINKDNYMDYLKLT